MFTIRQMLIAVAILCALLVPYSFLYNHLSTWMPAEATEELISELRSDIVTAGDDRITGEAVDEMLLTPKYKELATIRSTEIVGINNEVVWFTPNKKFSICLTEDGTIIWMVYGER